MDLGGTSIKLGLFTGAGELAEKWAIPTRHENNGACILTDIASSIEEVLCSRGVDFSLVSGIGIGVPGPVDSEGYLPHIANIGWTEGRNISRELTELTGLKVVAANDANVAALGEAWRGAASGCDNVIMLTLGTGVGGGIIVGGQIIAGSHGAGGEIGHMHIADDIPGKCGCGNSGCLEQVASATGIVNLAKRAGIEGVCEAKDVFDGLKAGDATCEEVVDTSARYLGNAISILAAVLDPEAIVIGGGVSKAGPVLLEYIRKHYLKTCFRSNREVIFKLAELGNDAGIYGAAKLISE